ncbi:MAG: hypothetical protein IPK84_03260 [Candidatus Moraniibacteriota bacterium]|nr:MAG: hypothetical protein IPK84_03260 [Candidatus Moranbacteria bacterium]
MAKKRNAGQRALGFINTKEAPSLAEPVDTEETPPSAESVDIEEFQFGKGSLAKTVDYVLREGDPNFFAGVYDHLDREPDYTIGCNGKY